MTDDDTARCRTLADDDGTVLAHWHGQALDERGEAAMRALVAAVHQHAEGLDDPDLGQRQAANIARIRERAGLTPASSDQGEQE